MSEKDDFKIEDYMIPLTEEEKLLMEKADFEASLPTRCAVCGTTDSPVWEYMKGYGMIECQVWIGTDLGQLCEKCAARYQPPKKTPQ